MAITPSVRRAIWLALLAALGLTAALFVSCSSLSRPAVTPTPTRTPRPPTATPTPIPSPTPTPAWPVTADCSAETPEEVCRRLRDAVDQDPEHFAWTDDVTGADVRLGRLEEGSTGRPFATWVYALVAPFFTLEDGVSLADLSSTWAGEPSGAFVEHPLLASADTVTALPLGETDGSVHVVEASEVLTQAIERDMWAIVPFHELDPRWKVLSVDGVSPLQRGLNTEAYPLATSLHLESEGRPDALSLLPDHVTNRDPEKMSVVMMTGVTALTRRTATTMEREGVTYPAGDIQEWLTEPDITHISNEVSFTDECPAPTGESTMVFCSDTRYFELLEHVDTDVLELTGNHLLDWGEGAMEASLALYEERNLPYFGGGWTLEEARQPVTMTHGVHTFGFIGCNPIGPAYAWATAERPGAASCDYQQMANHVRALRDAGVIPIVTFQYWEFNQYAPTTAQVADFQAMADAGAEIVSGSQAHWPQGFGFHEGTFIHYGLGNLFFDQMQRIEYRQEFLDRHVFYDGEHISTQLLTAMLEDYARPRPMTAEERRALLETTFAVSGW